jgi:hypothetical protein
MGLEDQKQSNGKIKSFGSPANAFFESHHLIPPVGAGLPAKDLNAPRLSC